MPDARESSRPPITPSLTGAIQPHGWLVVCDARAVKILRHSANLADLFPGRTFIGTKLSDLLGSATAHGLRNSLARITVPARPALLPNCVFPGCEGAFDLTTSQAGEETLVEIEKAEPEMDRQALDRVRTMVERISVATELERLLQTAARLVFSVLHYDRVDILRFRADGTAERVAGQHSHDLEASEAPPELPASCRRELQSELMRVVANVEAPPAEILSEPGARPLDLTLAHLRAVSDDEREALAREGFVASLSIALPIDGVLWGALLCRNRQARKPATDMRTGLDIFAGFLALRVQVLLQKKALGKG
jgi:light-regulated signal transduction histidine kinase (bacteriophytochrome)